MVIHFVDIGGIVDRKKLFYISNAMSWSFFVFNDLNQEGVVHFVENGGIVDHHYLNFLVII